VSDTRTHGPVSRIVEELREAVAARKCYACGCFQDALAQLSASLPSLPSPDREHLSSVLREGADRVVPRKYDCLGCEVCWPANALNSAAEAYPDTIAAHACPADAPLRARTWPPLPGEYHVFDTGGRIAVCVLTSKSLMNALIANYPPHVAIVGMLHTENLGIERLITNVMANPNLTTLVVCGADSQQRIGHRPGQSLLSLIAHGTDEAGRIREATGHRPILRNLSPDTVEVFRRELSVIDRLGEERLDAVLQALAAAPSGNGSRRTHVSAADDGNLACAGPPSDLVLDPNGYFILFPDRNREVLLVEHYTNDGVLAHSITGRTAQELYATIIARGLVSRLDHAAYLGTELARAERCLETGEPYVQDRAPEPTRRGGCGCHPPADIERE